MKYVVYYELSVAELLSSVTKCFFVNMNNHKVGFSHPSHDFDERVTLIDPEKVSIGITRPRSVTSESALSDDAEPENIFEMPEKRLAKALHIVLFPIKFVFFISIPDVRRPFFRRFPLYFVSFIVSTIYLGLITYVLVWMVVVIAYTFNVPDTVAGLTVLAAGTSVPEVVASVIITRKKGKGEMVIANSLGSNIFDILICLGLPWFVSTAITNGDRGGVTIYSKGIFYSTAILMATVFVLIIAFVLNRWRLDRKFGILMFVVWVLVTVITCLFEYDVFGDFSLPLC